MEKTCSICKKTYTGENFYDMRQYFTSNKSTRDGLDTRCKACKRELGRKYRGRDYGNTNNYAESSKRRALGSGYINNNPRNMTTSDIESAIKALELRVETLKQELEFRNEQNTIEEEME